MCSETEMQQLVTGRPGHSAEMCWRNFVVYILEDFAGDFPGGFFWALFPTKMRRENAARKSAKRSGGSKIKICEKSVLPKAGPKTCAHSAEDRLRVARTTFLGGGRGGDFETRRMSPTFF